MFGCILLTRLLVFWHVIVYSSDAMSHSAGANICFPQSKTPTSSVWCGTVGGRGSGGVEISVAYHVGLRWV